MLFAFSHAVVWAITSLFLRSLTAKLGVFVLNGLRGAAALLVIIPMALVAGSIEDLRLLTGPKIFFLITSIIGGGVFGSILYLRSLRMLGVTRAFPISNSYPLFTVFFSFVLLQETVKWPVIPGTLLVLTGVYLISRIPQHRGEVEPQTVAPQVVVAGVLSALAASVLWGCSTVVFSLGLQGTNAHVANSIRIPVMAGVSLGIAALRKETHAVARLDLKTVILLIVSGVLGWGVGASLYALSVQHAGASMTSIIAATAPLFAMPLSILVFRERPIAPTILGTVLAVVGIAIVVGA